MEFNRMIPELSVFDIRETVGFYLQLGFIVEYERQVDQFVFMSFQGSQLMFEQIHEDGWNIGALEPPLGRGINFSIAVDDIDQFYEKVKNLPITLYRELTSTVYLVNDLQKEQKEFLLQDPNGYLLRFTN